ncbi:MAG TPA: ABC transporter ATP-binding protein [Burkholderiales bacterium]|nr:ABC transporter ATP-binding protein [Burkholderiales bacterium]
MILQIEQLTRHYGGVRAVDGVSCSVEEGSVTALIGPNGAGKTTLLNVASGVTPPSSGRVLFGGTDITGERADDICRAGIARTFQTPQLFPTMSVLENVLVGATPRGHINLIESALHLPRAAREEVQLRAEAIELLHGLGLPQLADAAVGTLPFGLQRRVEVARALASHPKLVMMDEPASGLSRAETEELRALVATIAGRGITVLLVEHNMRLVMSIASRVLVLDKGKLLAAGSPAEVQANREVQRAYLGS